MSLQKPPLYQEHAAADADFTDFGGWEMPVSFESITSEHRAVRESAGIFDVSHMGEVSVSGPDATELMNRLTTNAVESLGPDDAQYACILREDGSILDDTVVYRYPDEEGYLFVPNAGNDAEMASRWSEFARRWDLDASARNLTDERGMIAVQGPDAVERVAEGADHPVEDLSRFSAARTTIDDVPCLVARTGYTGEDGFEIIFPSEGAETVWRAFDDVQPCGLGARDTLRLEAGLLLSGQDFHPEEEPRTPYEAGLGFVVDLSKDRFVGRAELEAQKEAGADEQLVGIRVEGSGIARHGYPILVDGTEVGHVTSGTMSPTFDVPIALGYVDAEYAGDETDLQIDIRGRTVEATVVNHRFLETLGNNT